MARRESKIVLEEKYKTCPICGTMVTRHGKRTRTIKDLRRNLKITFDTYRCHECGNNFTANTDHYAPPGRRYSNRVIRKVVDLLEDNTFESTQFYMIDNFGIRIPISTMVDWKCEQNSSH